MNQLLLTCSGIEGEILTKRFAKMLNIPLCEAKVLWIPTAAIDEESVDYNAKCKNDLLTLGIEMKNITTYNLDEPLDINELNLYDVVFVGGGDCQYLFEKMVSSRFYQFLEKYQGLYVGVSAGSCVVSYDFPQYMNFLKCRLDVHCQNCTQYGRIDISKTDLISLTNAQAVVIDGKQIEVINIGEI